MLLLSFKSILFKQGKIFPVEDTHTQHTHTLMQQSEIRRAMLTIFQNLPPKTYNICLKNIKYSDHVISLTIDITTKSFTDCMYIWPQKMTFLKKADRLKYILGKINVR